MDKADSRLYLMLTERCFFIGFGLARLIDVSKEIIDPNFNTSKLIT